ncbi:Na+/H+ antiporter subunit G [Corynebacterium sp. HS2168-gen11]|uniref:Na+/H+ antiporter subunit G n=1 Tax=Corynebacterium sp. HS2168-gen11 TaxID=2974027 RepID=UPI00216B1207|nr:Na+/H+ antiporter subunit G [Corynebacterium sp. HS2168-gen11]MCS4535580.1 Na+/H+ antiporter subunit G [Corynebacterium sp. HS2168-gen11]
MVLELLAGLMIIAAGFIMVITALALWRCKDDPLTCANLFSPATAVALPLVILAKVIVDIAHHGFVFSDIFRAVIAIAGLLIVLSVGSFIMARSLYKEGHEQPH